MQSVLLYLFGMCRRRCPHRPADLPEDSDFLVQPCRNRPAEFARTSLSALGLPTPVVALACICSVGSLRCHLCKRSSFLNTAFASLHTASLEKGDSPRGGEMPAGQRGPLSTRGTAVRRWRDSFPATAANRFHKELHFFFSLLKRKKEAKKEKSSHSTCTVRFKYHPKITHQQKSPGGANRRLLPP